MRFFLTVFICLITVIPVFPQQNELIVSNANVAKSCINAKIIALVGTRIISTYDLNDRFMLSLFGHQHVTSFHAQHSHLKKALIRLMIEESLKLEHLKMEGFQVDDEQIKEMVAQLEHMHHMPLGSFAAFIQQHNISSRIARHYILSVVGWKTYLQQKYATQLKLTDVDRVWIQETSMKTSVLYHVFEILLYDHPHITYSDLKQDAESIAEMIRQGRPFSEAAQHFSQAASHAQGGDLGWMRADDMDPALRPALNDLREGNFSGPWRTQTGWAIIAVAGRQDDVSVHEMKQALSSQRLQQKLEAYSRQEMNRARRTIFIERRNEL